MTPFLFLTDILAKLGTKCSAPDYSTLSLRGRTLSIDIRIRPTKEDLHLVVDSTGIKVYGEGE